MRCCSPTESTFAQSLHLVEPDDEVRQGDLDQGLLDLAVVDDALLVGIRHDRAEVAEGDVRQLGHEHRVLPARGQAHAAGHERPKPCQALQQNRLADARRTADQQRVTRLETQVEIADEVLAVGSANSDTVDLERALLRRSRLSPG